MCGIELDHSKYFISPVSILVILPVTNILTFLGSNINFFCPLIGHFAFIFNIVCTNAFPPEKCSC